MELSCVLQSLKKKKHHETDIAGKIELVASFGTNVPIDNWTITAILPICRSSLPTVRIPR
jgi:hypothetical protein